VLLFVDKAIKVSSLAISPGSSSPILLADRTGRAYATVLRLSSVVVAVCDVMYCG